MKIKFSRKRVEMKNINVKPMSSENRENSLVRSFYNFAPVPEMKSIRNSETLEKSFFSYFQKPSMDSKAIERSSEEYFNGFGIIGVAEKAELLKTNEKETQVMLEPVKSEKGFCNFSPVPQMVKVKEIHPRSFFNYAPSPALKLESGDKDTSMFYVNYSPFVKEQPVKKERKSSGKGFCDRGVCVS